MIDKNFPVSTPSIWRPCGEARTAPDRTTVTLQHSIFARRAYAISMTSVRPSVRLSVTLVDCGNTMQYRR